VATRDEVIGKAVYGSDGERIGGVAAVFEDRETGKLEWLAVAKGMIGRGRVLVPVAGADVRETGVFVPYRSEQVEKTPEFEGDQVNEEQERRLYAHYGIRRSESRSPSGLPAGQKGNERTSGRGNRRAQTSRRPARRTSQQRSSASDEPTREQLYKEAKRLNVEGRSKMTKTQLARAVGRRRGRSSETSGSKANPVEVQKFLEGVGYPTGKRELVREAKSQGASKQVRSTLERLPEARFKTPAEVSKAIAKV
jgi:sporulation protein YlmC with PRC-barrel domain